VVDLPPLTYLSVDSLSEGVGASQVLPYVEALSRQGMSVTLHSLEKRQPAVGIVDRLEAAGVRWRPHPWGRAGSAGGLARLIRGAKYLRGADLVHARSDIPAGSALLACCRAWIWDMRGFWADERIEAGLLEAGSIAERVFRAIEHGAARRAGAIVTLSSAAISVLEQRHGVLVRDKARVITTCVDLDRFSLSPLPPGQPLQVLLAGTLGWRYDVPLMLRLVEELRRRRPTEMTALVPAPSPWDRTLRDAGIEIRRAAPGEMPRRVSASHVGLSLLRIGSSVAMKASMPTKIGEFLASGRPIVVNAGLGDLDRLLTKYDCGVILPGDTTEGINDGADSLERLLADPGTPNRCRQLAEDHFSLDTAVHTLKDTYAAVHSALLTGM
jgi:glycosyltransferase involved in cell wall biosynthesis